MRGIVCALTLLFVACFAERVSYTGWKVLSMEYDIARQVQERLGEFHEWGKTHTKLDLMVPPTRFDAVVAFLKEVKAEVVVSVEDVQEDYDRVLRLNEQAKATVRSKHGNNTSRFLDPSWYEAYHDWDEIDEWMDTIQSAYPSLVNIVGIGDTFEGRHLRAFVITGTPHWEKNRLWFDAVIHAREWIGSGVINFCVWQMLEQYGKDPVWTALLDRWEFTILPIFNADGYQFAHDNDRNWRKTRKPNPGAPDRPECIGTDPNRNFGGHDWGGEGTSPNPCANNFHGEYPFSEPEIKAVEVYVKKSDFHASLNLHSFGEMILLPWGWTRELPPDHRAHMECGGAMREAVFRSIGRTYATGPIYTVIYPAAGTHCDWAYTSVAYDGAELPFSITYELDTTHNAPPERIVPTGRAILDSLVAYTGCVER